MGRRARARARTDGTGQDLFDKAVSCDGNTITYKLAQPVADFNYTVTLGFAAVPNPTDHPGADTGEGYDTAPWSDGPYMITNFTAGVGGNLTLERNPNWSAERRRLPSGISGQVGGQLWYRSEGCGPAPDDPDW